MFEIDLGNLKKQKEYPEFCTACGKSLTSEDGIMKKINKIKSEYRQEKEKRRIKKSYSLRNYGRYQNELGKERKAARTFVPEIEKFNKLLRLERSEVKHDICKGSTTYCMYDGNELKTYGFTGAQNGYETNLVCPECRHYDKRPMTLKDRSMFLANSPVIAKMLL